MKNTRVLLQNRNSLVFEYYIVFIVILYAGNATTFANSLESWANPIGFALPVISIVIFAFLKGVHFNYKYWLLLLGYTIYFAASTIKFGTLHLRFFGINFINFSIAYIIVSGLRYKYFKIYEDILYYLCIIAIVFWTLENIIPSTFIELLRNFEFSGQQAGGNVDYNTIIYTVNNFKVAPTMIMNLGGVRIIRNAGFAWEPGAFSTYVNFAILFNLMRNRFRLKEKRRLWVFVIALFTTFSTTGYSLFILLVLFYIYNQQLIKIVYLIPIVVILMIYIFTAPFMLEKISKISKPKYTTAQMIYYSKKYKEHFSPQRFQSLQIDFIDFLNNPIIGYGGHQKARWTNKLGAQIFTVSGIGKVLAQYGSVGLLFFLFSLWKSSRQLIKMFEVKGTIFPVLFVLSISISYNIMILLYLSIWLLYITSIPNPKLIKRYEMLRVWSANQ